MPLGLVLKRDVSFNEHSIFRKPFPLSDHNDLFTLFPGLDFTEGAGSDFEHAVTSTGKSGICEWLDRNFARISRRAGFFFLQTRGIIGRTHV